MEKTIQKEYRAKLNEMFEIWNTIAEPKLNIQVWEKEEGYFDITVNGKDFASNLFENEIENNLEYLSSYINGCIDIKNGKDLFGIFS